MKQIPIDDFERRYRLDPDPWRFATSVYEQRRYDITVACLPRPRFHRAFEPGCAIGELTKRIANRCDHVIAWDGSPTVVDRARLRLADRSNVEFGAGVVPGEWPTGPFDLIVLSEIGYYFDVSGLQQLAVRSIESLEVGGTLLGVHWLGASDDHLIKGDEVHDQLDAILPLACEGSFRDGGFRLDWWCGH